VIQANPSWKYLKAAGRRTFHASVSLEKLYFGPEDDAAPGSMQPIIRINDDGEWQIELMRWGSRETMASSSSNARAEGIANVNFWKKSFSFRRCIVPADSFLEWQKTQQGKKPKFEFTIRDRKPIWHGRSMSPWKNPKTNHWEDTFAIVTVEANETMAPVHNHQPAILAPRDYQEYLENAERPPIHLLRVFQDDEMRAEEIDQEAISIEQASLFDSQ
jgi:putative SOS response-associated peptidase YedK